jgi:hypothetical protein
MSVAVPQSKVKISASNFASSPVGMMVGLVGNLKNGKTQRNRVKRDFDDMSRFLNRGANNIRRVNLPGRAGRKKLEATRIQGGGGGFNLGGLPGLIMDPLGGLLNLGGDLLGLADLANDLRPGRGRNVGRDGRTAAQRAKDIKKLKKTGQAADAAGDAVKGAKQGAKILDGIGDATRGLRSVKGASKANAALNIATAGLEFAGRKSEGQTNTQAAVGTAADVGGGMAGFALASKATATALSPLIVTPVPGARVLYGIAVLGAGIIGSMAGSKLAASGADKLTGADKVGEKLEDFNKKKKDEEAEAKEEKAAAPEKILAFDELIDKFELSVKAFENAVRSNKVVRRITPGAGPSSPSSSSGPQRTANNANVKEFKGGAGVIGVSHPETGSGYGIAGQTDQSGRPVVFSKPAAAQFAAALKESGIDLGSYIASSGRSEAKNRSLPGGHPNSHHMYGEAIDMNGAGYEWMKENGHRFGWQYVYNHGPGSAHFKYVGPGAGTTPKLAPPGQKPTDVAAEPVKPAPADGDDGARPETEVEIDKTKTRAGVDRNTVIDEDTGFTAGEMEDIQIKQERIKAMREVLGRGDILTSNLDWLSGQATIEGYSKMLEDRGKGEEVDRIMNEIQGGYVQKVKPTPKPTPQVTPQVTPSPAPQQTMRQASSQISGYQSYEQGGSEVVVMPISGSNQQPQMMSGPGGQQMMIVPVPIGDSVNRIQKELLTTKLAGC